MKKSCKKFLPILAAALVISVIMSLAGNANVRADDENGQEQVILRVSNWEEYIDEGNWDEEETIDLESGDIIGEAPMIDDFEEWYLETYGIRVKVEYSCFGTNEDLYNSLSIGDVFDLVCPSEYMFMKLMTEGALQPFSDEFFDEEDGFNYYTNGVSPFIRDIFDSHEINGELWSKYAAGYMWGITGIVYNPEEMTAQEASSWNVLADPKFRKKITIKDNVRDSYFVAVGAVKHDLLTSEEFLSAPDYRERLEEEMNDVSDETMAKALQFLKAAKDNVYSFETELGKADMMTGKIVANYQWSGDAVYTLDQADEDDFTLEFAVPEEASNIYFDGWVMLKKGIEEDSAKQHAAEAFINFISRPDNVIRNMYYGGYTSVISGGEDERIFEYADWCYGAEEDEEDTEEYDIGYFFEEEEDRGSGEYVITAPADQVYRQLFSQYPSEEAIGHTAIMVNFDNETTEKINQMWINVRCFSILDTPVWVWIVCGVIAVLAVLLVIRKLRKKY